MEVTNNLKGDNMSIDSGINNVYRSSVMPSSPVQGNSPGSAAAIAALKKDSDALAIELYNDQQNPTITPEQAKALKDLAAKISADVDAVKKFMPADAQKPGYTGPGADEIKALNDARANTESTVSAYCDHKQPGKDYNDVDAGMEYNHLEDSQLFGEGYLSKMYDAAQNVPIK